MAEVDVEDVRRQAQSLKEIRDEPEFEASLKRWDENLKLILTRIESIRARAQAAKNEIYLLISFYLVFQGGVMNVLASKANAKKCEYALWLSLLSIVALFGVVVSVHDKFHEYHEMKKKRQIEEKESRVSDLCPQFSKFSCVIRNSMLQLTIYRI